MAEPSIFENTTWSLPEGFSGLDVTPGMLGFDPGLLEDIDMDVPIYSVSPGMGGQPGNTYVFSTGIEQYKNRLDLGADYASINDVDNVDNFYDQGYLFGLNNMQVDTETYLRESNSPAYLADYGKPATIDKTTQAFLSVKDLTSTGDIAAALSSYYGYDIQAKNQELGSFGGNLTSHSSSSKADLQQFHSFVEPILREQVPYLQATQGLSYQDALMTAYQSDPMLQALYHKYDVKPVRQSKDGSTYLYDPFSFGEIRTFESIDTDPLETFVMAAAAWALGTTIIGPAISGAVSGAGNAAASAAGLSASAATTVGTTAANMATQAAVAAIMGGDPLSAALISGIPIGKIPVPGSNGTLNFEQWVANNVNDLFLGGGPLTTGVGGNFTLNIGQSPLQTAIMQASLAASGGNVGTGVGTGATPDFNPYINNIAASVAGTTVEEEEERYNNELNLLLNVLDNEDTTTEPVDTTDTQPDPVDSDGDGVTDDLDAFPNNANETTDTDGDGVGDNAQREAEEAAKEAQRIADEKAEEQRIADEKAEEAQRIADERAEEAQRIADAEAEEKAKEAQRIADKKAEEQRIADEKAAEAKRLADFEAEGGAIGYAERIREQERLEREALEARNQEDFDIEVDTTVDNTEPELDDPEIYQKAPIPPEENASGGGGGGGSSEGGGASGTGGGAGAGDASGETEKLPFWQILEKFADGSVIARDQKGNVVKLGPEYWNADNDGDGKPDALNGETYSEDEATTTQQDWTLIFSNISRNSTGSYEYGGQTLSSQEIQARAEGGDAFAATTDAGITDGAGTGNSSYIDSSGDAAAGINTGGGTEGTGTGSGSSAGGAGTGTAGGATGEGTGEGTGTGTGTGSGSGSGSGTGTGTGDGSGSGAGAGAGTGTGMFGGAAGQSSVTDLVFSDYVKRYEAPELLKRVLPLQGYQAPQGLFKGII